MNKNLKENISGKRDDLFHKYTLFEELINNLPYILMAVIGGIIILSGYKISFQGWLLAGSYILYSIIGAFWIIIFICPYCHYYNTRACPCGYGKISGKLRQKGDENLFRKKFNMHISVIVPLWIIPLIAGIIFLINNYSLFMLALIIIFSVNSFIILPLLSRKHGCADCPQKKNCPWMRSRSGR